MKACAQPLQILRAHARTYVVLNAMAYGLLLAGMALALTFPNLSTSSAQLMDASGTTDQVVQLLQRPWLFAIAILGVNVARIAIATIVLPSMIVPFVGIAAFAVWALQTGIALAPVDHATTMTLIPHSLTVVIEFQAYLLLLLGAYLLGRAWVWPRSVDATNRRHAYLRGLTQLGWLALPSLLLLGIGAVYESVSLAYVLPLLL